MRQDVSAAFRVPMGALEAQGPKTHDLEFHLRCMQLHFLSFDAQAAARGRTNTAGARGLQRLRLRELVRKTANRIQHQLIMST